jgi:hypothetical protein
MEDPDSVRDGSSAIADPWGGPPQRLWRPISQVEHLKLTGRRACYAGDEVYQYDLRVVREPVRNPFGPGREVQLVHEEDWYVWRGPCACRPPTRWPRYCRWIPADLVYVEVLSLEVETRAAA